MSMCESVRGEWGQICPDCGQRLPSPGKVTSWKSTHDVMWGKHSGVRGWTDAQLEAARKSRTFAGSDRAA